MKHATVNTSNYPIVVVTFAPVGNTREGIDDYINEMAALIEKGKNLIIIYDTTKAKYLPAEARIKIGNYLRDNADLIQNTCKAFVYIIDSVIGRVVTNCIFAINPPPVPYAIFNSLEQGERWSMAKLSQQQVITTDANYSGGGSNMLFQ